MSKVALIPSPGDSVFVSIDSENIGGTIRFISLLFCYLCLIVGITMFSGANGAYLMLVPLVVAMVYFSTIHPMKAVMCFFAFLSMEGMYRYLTKFSGFSYLLSPLMTGILVASFQFHGFLSFNKARLMPYSGLFVFVLFIGFLAVFNPKGAGIYEGVAAYSFWYLCPMLMYPLVYYIKKEKTDYALFLITLISVSIFVSLVAILQYSQGEIWTNRSFPGSETVEKMGLSFKNKTIFRPMGMSTIQGGSSVWSAIGILPSFVLLTHSKMKIYIRIICLFSLIVDFYAIFIAGARATLMIVLIQLFLYMLLNVNSMKGAIRTALVFLLMIGLFRASFIVAENSTDGFVGQRFENILSDPAATFQKERGSNFEVIVPMILEDPFGIGYQRAAIGGKEGTRSMTKNRETQFAALIGDWGLIGMVSMMILFFVFLQKMFKIFKKKNAASYFLAQVFTCYLTSYVIGMIVGPILQANYFVWMLIAMSMNLDQSNQESRSDSERASFSATV